MPPCACARAADVPLIGTTRKAHQHLSGHFPLPHRVPDHRRSQVVASVENLRRPTRGPDDCFAVFSRPTRILHSRLDGVDRVEVVVWPLLALIGVRKCHQHVATVTLRRVRRRPKGGRFPREQPCGEAPSRIGVMALFRTLHDAQYYSFTDFSADLAIRRMSAHELDERRLTSAIHRDNHAVGVSPGIEDHAIPLYCSGRRVSSRNVLETSPPRATKRSIQFSKCRPRFRVMSPRSAKACCC